MFEHVLPLFAHALTCFLLQDPCDGCAEMLHLLVDWYLDARKAIHTEDEVLKLAEKGFHLQEYLLANFPEKDGTCCMILMFSYALANL